MAVIPQPWRPHAYQRRMVKNLVANGAHGVLADPGLGKTSIILAAQKLLKRAYGGRFRLLVLAPLRVAQLVWVQEAAKWSDFAETRVVLAHGPRKLEALMDEYADIVVMNYEGLDWLTRQAGWHFDGVVFDESTRLKGSSGKKVRFKIVQKLLPLFARRYILTGTPVPNGLLDLWGQVYLLDQGGALGRFISHYRAKYFDPSGFGGYDWKLKPGAEKLIYGQVAPLVTRLSAADYLELPPITYSNIEVELPATARKAYDDLERDFVAYVGKNPDRVTAVNAASLSSKIRQVVNGGLYADDGGVVGMHAAKTEAVVDLVEQLQGAPLLVAYDTHHDLARLRQAFPSAPHLGGGVTKKKADATLDAWNRGAVPVLLAHPQSVSHGLNMQAGGRHVCWHSLTWDLEGYEQLNRRVWRQGQRDPCFVYHVVARDTIDFPMLDRLRGKATVQEALLAALNRRKKG